MIPRVKGTQDHLDMRLLNYLIAVLKKQLTQYNFNEIQLPLLESVDLFQRSLGEHTEVVSKEMFIIEARQETHERICLRPEMTAPVVRAFNEHAITNVPWKVFSYGPCFRYERPQKGRYRQFTQCTMEVIGSESVSQDAQFIMMLDRFFHETLSLDTYSLMINYLGCTADRKKFAQLLKEFLESDKAAGICEQCVYRKDHNILRVFDCKNEHCQGLYQDAPTMVDALCSECSNEWSILQNELQLLSVSYFHNPRLVRGLDYYNKTVFEFMSSNLGAQSAFCGGGRYNQLVQELGNKTDHPAIGAAIGIERLLLLLEPFQERFELEDDNPLHVVIPLSQEQHTLGLLLADALRAAQLRADVLFEGSVKSMMRKASKMGAAYVLLIGEQEQQNGTVVIKNMVTGEEEVVAQVNAIAAVHR